MKKIIFFAMLLLLVSGVSALSFNVRYFDGIFLVNVENDGTEDLDDLKIRIIILDDGNIYQSKTFDLDSNDNRGTYILIDEPAQETVVKVTVRNDDVRRSRYFFI